MSDIRILHTAIRHFRPHTIKDVPEILHLDALPHFLDEHFI